MRISRKACRASQSLAGHLRVFSSHSLSAYLGSCTRFQSPSALSYCPSSHSAAARAALGSSKSGYLLRRLLRSTQHALCSHKPAQGFPSHLACTGTLPGNLKLHCARCKAAEWLIAHSHGQPRVDIQDSEFKKTPHFPHSLSGLAACVEGERPVGYGKAEGWRKLHSLLVVPGRLCPLLLCKGHVPCSASQAVTGVGGQAEDRHTEWGGCPQVPPRDSLLTGQRLYPDCSSRWDRLAWLPAPSCMPWEALSMCTCLTQHISIKTSLQSSGI